MQNKKVMVKANSLLYAIYICLIVSLLCGALLYFATLYNQLNIHFNLREEIYIHNQSVVHFALDNSMQSEDFPEEENSAIQGAFTIKPFGLLNVVIAQSIYQNDTIQSVHFVGSTHKDSTSIYLASNSKNLSYSGKVQLLGNRFLPAPYIESQYITSKPNVLTVKGKSTISEIRLPEINPQFSKILNSNQIEKQTLSAIEKVKDSIFFNSFSKNTKQITIASTLSNVIFKGNFLLHNKDSIYVRKNTILEDVILMAPKITFEDGFTGNVQAFASQQITIKNKVNLQYPSVVCVYNPTSEESSLTIGKDGSIKGAIVLFGNTMENISKNKLEIAENNSIIGDIYCTGKLDLKSNVFGSVYTNRFFLKTSTSIYENLISDVEINCFKKPGYFLSIPLFEPKKTSYGILKKVL